MTNFDTFLSIPQFSSFAPVAVSAERILPIDPSACVLNCRRAMEFAVKWMYSVDKALVMPDQDSLVSLMNTEDFRDIVGADIWRCVWKISIFFWILWRTATARTTPKDISTMRC